MRRAVVAAALGLMLLGALAACGRKGALEPPPSGAIEAPVGAMAA